MQEALVVFVLSPFVVRVAEPKVTLPAHASEPTVSFKLARSRVAPDATVNALAAENAFAAPACSVPALTAVAPEYVPAPDSVRLPVPILVRPPVPAMAPEKVVFVLSPFVVRVAEPKVTLPEPATAPMVSFKLATSA